MSWNRRGFLAASGAGVAALCADFFDLAASQLAADDPAGGRLVRTIPVGRVDGPARPPLGQLLGSGLDARQFADLSSLTPGTLVTPNDRFFIRTAFSAANTQPGPWVIQVGGLVRRPATLALADLTELEQSLGLHLIECSGNSDPANFGLLSAAEWSGVRITTLADRVQPASDRWRVRISGLDDVVSLTRSSVPGASWIFSRDDLERAGAFLATRMNGAVLPSDHGFPVRLIVPGWYGCTCIKWVSSIDLVEDDEAATTQMREFAARTHQQGVPALARDFAPAIMDVAAMPVRVEQWLVEGRTVYRVVGVIWGGARPTNALTIRFKYGQPFVRVSHCPLPESTATRSLWSHLWRPVTPGRYQIVLRVDDPAIRTRRLDLFFYTREVQIDEV